MIKNNFKAINPSIKQVEKPNEYLIPSITKFKIDNY